MPGHDHHDGHEHYGDHDHAGPDRGPGGHHHHAPPAGFDGAFALGSALNADPSAPFKGRAFHPTTLPFELERSRSPPYRVPPC
jgi:hypothetical protein